MRLLFATGSLLLLTGGAVFYFFFHGALVGLIGHLTYDPDMSEARTAAAFERLAMAPSDMPGVTIGAIAEARRACLAGDAPAPADEAFRRLNLVMLGAGVESLSPVISPAARRAALARPDIAHGDGHWDDLVAATDAAAIAALGDPDAPIYHGLDLSAATTRSALRRLMTTMAAGGDALRKC